MKKQKFKERLKLELPKACWYIPLESWLLLYLHLSIFNLLNQEANS